MSVATIAFTSAAEDESSSGALCCIGAAPHFAYWTPVKVAGPLDVRAGNWLAGGRMPLTRVIQRYLAVPNRKFPNYIRTVKRKHCTGTRGPAQTGTRGWAVCVMGQTELGVTRVGCVLHCGRDR